MAVRYCPFKGHLLGLLKRYEAQFTRPMPRLKEVIRGCTWGQKLEATRPTADSTVPTPIDAQAPWLVPFFQYRPPQTVAPTHRYRVPIREVTMIRYSLGLNQCQRQWRTGPPPGRHRRSQRMCCLGLRGFLRKGGAHPG